MKKILLWGFGIVFAAAGTLGWAPNPLLGADGFFETNHVHDLLHLASGIGFILAALLMSRYARPFLLAGGALYFAVAALGWLMAPSGGELLDYFHVNAADHWLHTGLAVLLIGAGVLAGKSAEPVLAAQPPQPLA